VLMREREREERDRMMRDFYFFIIQDKCWRENAISTPLDLNRFNDKKKDHH